MKTRVFFFLAAAVLLAGCAKEIQAPVELQNGEPFVLQVGINNPEPELESEPAQAPTRTYLGAKNEGKYPVYWSNGDAIKVNGLPSEALDGIADGTAKTSFTFLPANTPSTPYNIIYPAGIYGDENHVNLPAVQTYKADGFADGMFPMAGYSADGSGITLNHLCAIVKVSIKRATGGSADTDNLVAVRFKGRNSEKVSGSFEIIYATPALVAATGTDDDLEVKVAKSQATSTGTAVNYFIVVPARTYSSGFDIIVRDEKGHAMIKSKTSSTELTAGTLYSMSEFTFVPGGDDTGIEIATAEQLIQFAKDYNNKVYDDLGDDVLVATLTDNITFVDSADPNVAGSWAAFNATGGIGLKNGVNGATEDYYFTGIFNGGGHSISGLKATVPIFFYTEESSIIKNVTLSNSCSLTVNSPAAYTVPAPLVGRNKGLIKNCSSAASILINNIEDVESSSYHYGGLVGRNYGGVIEGCNVSGDITCSQTSVSVVVDSEGKSSNAIYIGGISGSNANSGSFSNCNYTGNITISDGNTYGGISLTYSYEKDANTVAGGLYCYVGGIVGYADNGEISDCTVATELAPKTMNIRGTFVPALGGIAGWVKTSASTSISNCDNYMSLSFASNGGRANTSPTRIGGIAARSAADISNSQNYGAIASSCNSTTLHLGGIVAEGTNIDKCINNATGTITRSNADQTTTQANRYMYIGGIMGINLSACDVTDCTNNAAVLSNAIGTATQTTIDISGIVASAGVTATPQQIDIESCENNGAVTLTNNGGTVTTRLTVAGILGYGAAANTTIKSCDNKAQIYCNSQTSAAGRVSYSGGIAGLMGTFAKGVAGLEIDDCTNSARVWNRNYNATVTPASSTPFGGGIVGAILGTDSSKANVHDCSTAGGDVVELRGYCGGIAGYAQNATIDDNTVSQVMTGSNANSQGAGGIIGWAVNTSLSGCTTSASLNSVKNIGGLVAKLDTGSSIENCNVDGASLTNGTNAAATAAAVLVSDAAKDVTITGCGIKGTINSSAITLSSNMITTDGGATITGTYLLP